MIELFRFLEIVVYCYEFYESVTGNITACGYSQVYKGNIE